MAFRVGVLRSCVVAGLFGLAVDAHAQSAASVAESDDGYDTTAESMVDAALPPSPPPVPRLTILPEEEAPPSPKARKKIVTNAPVGLPAGGLRLFPSLEIGSIYSSNVEQSPDNGRSAVGLRLAPSLRVESDWVRHSFRSSITGDYIAYAKNKKDNTASAAASSDLRIDIRRTTTLDLTGDYTLAPVRPSDTGLAGGPTGTRLDQTFNSAAALNQDFGPLTLSLKTNVERKLYGSEDLVGGGTRDNKDLNLWRPGVGLRVTYSEPPLIKPYAEVNYARRYHDRKLNSAGQNTDSGDIDARIGVAFDDEALWSGDLAVTYLRRSYDDDALANEQAFGVNGNITWRPTELTSVVLNAATSLDDTEVGGRSYELNAQVSQAVRDNVTLNLRGGVTLDDGSAGVDKTYSAGLGIDWQLAPEWAFTAAYDATMLKAAQSEQDYNEHRVSVGIVLRR